MTSAERRTLDRSLLARAPGQSGQNQRLLRALDARGAADLDFSLPLRQNQRLLRVHDALAPLLTQPGLRPGSVLAVAGPGALTLATALASEASRNGGWVTAVGLGRMGVSAIVERGASLGRWAFVDEPGKAAAEVLNALIGNVDVILLCGGVRLAAAHSRRLRARLREQGTVVIEIADTGALGTAGPRGVGALGTVGPRGVGALGTAGVLGPDVTLRVERAAWAGLGRGHGRLRRRRAEIVAVGRGAASLARRVVVWLPDEHGRITAVRGALPAAGADQSDQPDAAAGRDAGVDAGTGSGIVVELKRRAG